MRVSRLLNFSERANRKEYWLTTLILTVLSYGGLLLTYGLVSLTPDSFSWLPIILLVAVFALSTIAGLALQIRRWHDLDKSAWWILLPLVPLVGALWAFFELGFSKGTYGPNRYGKPPQ